MSGLAARNQRSRLGRRVLMLLMLKVAIFICSIRYVKRKCADACTARQSDARQAKRLASISASTRSGVEAEEGASRTEPLIIEMAIDANAVEIVNQQHCIR